MLIWLLLGELYEFCVVAMLLLLDHGRILR
jgi:hypothetical protein